MLFTSTHCRDNASHPVVGMLTMVENPEPTIASAVCFTTAKLGVPLSMIRREKHDLCHKEPVRTGTAENENVASSMAERGGERWGRFCPNRLQLARGSSGECHSPIVHVQNPGGEPGQYGQSQNHCAWTPQTLSFH